MPSNELENYEKCRALVDKLEGFSQYAINKNNWQTRYMFVTPAEWRLGRIDPQAAAADSSLPIVIFFHGISVASSASFFRLASSLLDSGRHRVLLFDFYGRGESDTPDPLVIFQYDGDFYLKQIEDLLQFLNLSNAKLSVVGLSMGGAIAGIFADAHPEQVENLILVAPAGLPFHLPLVAQIATAPYIGDMFTWLVAPLRIRWGFQTSYVQYRDHPASLAVTRETFERQMKYNPNFPWALLSTIRYFPLRGLQSTFERVSKHSRKTLIIWGTEDNVVPYSNCAALQKIIKDAMVLSIPKANHAVLHENPTEVRDAVFKLLAIPNHHSTIAG
eukprot:TRINITY_DN6860_c0_g1_i1.p1 TRINITY_DN6860_c0_g1~~TRINITY_DN6860_c0_g1_i1.p1  ORF type:complete len:331 (+),score=65.04 TRINITY_DN6860_c0_g1_i1:67-1059(+)